jgi:hemolysin activation/secretion protein
LSLGGAQGVRAFTVSDFSADSAALLSLEWYLPLPERWNPAFAGTTLNDVLQFGLFTDAAYGVQNSFQSDESDKWALLTGSGILFKLAWSDWFSSQLSFAVPSSSKSNLEGTGDKAESVQTFLDFTWVWQ